MSDAAVEALTLWELMGGWKPELLPVLIPLYEVVHLDGLGARLLAIRAALAENNG